MISRCPGQNSRDLKAELIKCPKCGYAVEIFSDEMKVKCPKCRSLVSRERVPSCIDWCPAAKECVGEQKYREHREQE